LKFGVPAGHSRSKWYPRCFADEQRAIEDGRKHPCNDRVHSTLFSRGESRRTIGRAEPDANRGATIVRLILGITLLLLGVGLLSCNVEGTANSEPTSPPAVRQWVRTTNGWERASSWHAAKAPRPRLHPLVVAAGQGLVSVLGLVAFRRDAR
jgi:hypothetical protein